MSENNPESVSSELVDLGEYDYKGFDPEMVNTAVLHNLTKMIKTSAADAAAAGMPIAMMKAFRLTPNEKDWDHAMALLMKSIAINHDMAVLIEKLIPFTSGHEGDKVAMRNLLGVIDNHPFIQKAKVQVLETAQEKLDRRAKETGKVRPHYNG